MGTWMKMTSTFEKMAAATLQAHHPLFPGSGVWRPHRRPRRPGQPRGPPGGDSASRPAMAVSFEIGRFPGASAPHTSPSPRPAPSCARPTRLSQPHARRRARRRAASRRARRQMTRLACLPPPAPSPHAPSASPVLTPVYPLGGRPESGLGAAEAAEHGPARPRRRPSRAPGLGGPRSARRARLRLPGAPELPLRAVPLVCDA